VSTNLDEVVKKLTRDAKRCPRTLLTWFDDDGAIRFGDRYIVLKVNVFASSRALHQH
jgi:hypothetical protein